MGRPKKPPALKLPKPRKTTPESKLSAKTRVILERTKVAKAASDAAVVGWVDDDPSTPFMIVTGPPRRKKHEQSEEPEEMAIAPAERKKRATKTAKARQKREENAKARRTRTAEMDAAIDDYMVNGAAVAREVVETLAPVMQVPASLHGVRIR